ncbi:hypothetical protein [Mesorhizobium sp. INR15]|uniref:hypothetical protein n=1 Tax=Mesorhizobium sp. INR15 TaxID=2654248 RepID=UPI0018965673|nr:hypothetical protein [Mesorhizobium sp. INR15]QPC94096.1 hypothetical protein GA829_27860 [Mesorhizobium sp. INR15]
MLGHIRQIDLVVSELLRVTKETCIFTIWPSDDLDIAESTETVEGVRFLHRQYSDQYIQKIVRTAGRKILKGIETVALGSGGRAYIVKRLP